VAELDPDQEAALRRLRAAFGFVEVLWILDHHDDQDHDRDDGESLEEGEELPPVDR
jgi:predicted outer membrane lipoprotein